MLFSAIALEYFYHHAADQVRLGNIQLGENAFQLKHLQDQGDFPAFLRSVRNYQVSLSGLYDVLNLGLADFQWCYG